MSDNTEPERTAHLAAPRQFGQRVKRHRKRLPPRVKAVTRRSSERPQFYRWGNGRFFGNLYWHCLAGGLYAAFALLPVILALLGRDLSELAMQPLSLLWALVTSIAYPIWSWREVNAFEAWLPSQPEASRARERDHFASAAAATRNFWTAVLATYTIAGVWRLAASSSPPCP